MYQICPSFSIVKEGAGSVPELSANSSVKALPGGRSPPPIHKAEVAVPQPFAYALPVAKSPVSVQEVPFHFSVSVLILAGTPPPPPGIVAPAKYSAFSVSVTAAAPIPLSVVKSATSDQEVPFHYSTFA